MTLRLFVKHTTLVASTKILSERITRNGTTTHLPRTLHNVSCYLAVAYLLLLFNLITFVCLLLLFKDAPENAPGMGFGMRPFGGMRGNRPPFMARPPFHGRPPFQHNNGFSPRPNFNNRPPFFNNNLPPRPNFQHRPPPPHSFNSMSPQRPSFERPPLPPHQNQRGPPPPPPSQQQQPQQHTPRPPQPPQRPSFDQSPARDGDAERQRIARAPPGRVVDNTPAFLQE
eukprot:m.83993 g.83993  ORF g.83993 m.83993 type:complete len:227 (+) comp12140_c2_seq2:86-766(+)